MAGGRVAGKCAYQQDARWQYAARGAAAVSIAMPALMPVTPCRAKRKRRLLPPSLRARCAVQRTFQRPRHGRYAP